MKEEKLFNLAEEFHIQLMLITHEIDYQEMCEAEGSMQDVKAKIRDQYTKY